jgi:hypothetical protein
VARCPVAGRSGSGMNGEDPVILSPVLTTGQAASLVIGQNTFDAGAANQGGTPSLATLRRSYAPPLLHNGVLYVPDGGNNRILVYNEGITTENGAAASFVLGQSSADDTTAGVTAEKFNRPNQMLIHNGKFLLTDALNNRVLIWNTIPTANTPADLVLGQENMTSNDSGGTASGMSSPLGMAIVDGKLVVVDNNNNRLLVWNTFPPPKTARLRMLLSGRITLQQPAQTAAGM